MDKKYEFYIYHDSIGGHQHYSVKYTYIHGCPSSVAQYIQGSTFYNLVTKFIGESKFDVWEMNGTVTPYPNCQFEKFEITDMKYNGNPSVNGVSIAQSCGGADPCRFVDLDYVNHKHDVSFRIKVTMTSNNIAFSNVVTINVRCN